MKKHGLNFDDLGFIPPFTSLESLDWAGIQSLIDAIDEERDTKDLWRST